jgi:hypothetical protein
LIPATVHTTFRLHGRDQRIIKHVMALNQETKQFKGGTMMRNPSSIFIVFLTGTFCFLNAQPAHIMTGKVVKDTTFTACTYNPDATEQVGFYNTLSNGMPLFIDISGMS